MLWMESSPLLLLFLLLSLLLSQLLLQLHSRSMAATPSSRVGSMREAVVDVASSWHSAIAWTQLWRRATTTASEYRNSSAV